jgi:hypothetical protein
MGETTWQEAFLYSFNSQRNAGDPEDFSHPNAG